MIKFKILIVCIFLSGYTFLEEKPEPCDVIFVNNSKGFISLNNLSILNIKERYIKYKSKLSRGY